MIVMKNKQTNKKTKLNNMDKGKHQIQRAIFFFQAMVHQMLYWVMASIYFSRDDAPSAFQLERCLGGFNEWCTKTQIGVYLRKYSTTDN